MFLRRTKRIKHGKEHRYWSVVENRRVSAKRTFQKTLLYLGEINDTERASWTRAIEALDEDKQAHQINLFPEDRTPLPTSKPPPFSSTSAALNSPVPANGVAAGLPLNSGNPCSEPRAKTPLGFKH